MSSVRDAAIVISLLAAVAGIVVVDIVSGAGALASTRLTDLALVLGGALAGVSMQSSK